MLSVTSQSKPQCPSAMSLASLHRWNSKFDSIKEIDSELLFSSQSLKTNCVIFNPLKETIYKIHPFKISIGLLFVDTERIQQYYKKENFTSQFKGHQKEESWNILLFSIFSLNHSKSNSTDTLYHCIHMMLNYKPLSLLLWPKESPDFAVIQIVGCDPWFLANTVQRLQLAQGKRHSSGDGMKSTFSSLTAG